MLHQEVAELIIYLVPMRHPYGIVVLLSVKILNHRNITGTSLTMTDSSAPLLEVAACVTATCTLDNSIVSVPSGILMYVMADGQWSTSGAVGNLILANGTYTGTVKYDSGYTANAPMMRISAAGGLLHEVAPLRRYLRVRPTHACRP